MPELPEVETTVRYISKALNNKRIVGTLIRQDSLRYKIRADLPQLLSDKRVTDITRRGKYIIISLSEGYLIVHLGMSGSLEITDATQPVKKHSHCDIEFGDIILRYNDPRRFGCILWEEDIKANRLLNNLGIEPLSSRFSGDYLYRITRERESKIKVFIMNPQNLVGVGNIYATESLWQAGIMPDRSAKDCSLDECTDLVASIRKTLRKAIKAGGTSLRDFKSPDGKLGYFVTKLNIYGKEDERCPKCGNIIKRMVLAQRASFYCMQCQK